VAEAMPPVDARQPADVRRWLPWVGIAVAVWATLPQFSGPTLLTEPEKEVVDHIIPGALVVLACVVVLARRGQAAGPSMVPFVAGLVVLLAGFWMVATHVPLVAQAMRGEAPWPATLYHSSPAFAVFGFGLLWTVAHWSDLDALEGDDKAAAKKRAEKPASSEG
jgi:hypothetical protein